MVLEARDNNLLQKAFNEAALIVPDSSGLALAARFLGGRDLELYPGIDLAWDACRWAKENSLSVFLVGGKEEVVEKAALHLQEAIPGFLLAGTHHGYFSPAEDEKVIAMIRSSGARLILVGFGMPRQEIWISQHRKQLPDGVYIGVGGTFDVWSGKLKRAPQWMRNQGLEWVYRLFQEPFRWRRIAQLPKFAFLVLKERFRF
jgi:N-acetylglucosaminyldiphosphoundecaprenol N-acetyl-beta-D-mannosaminyltransferase